MLLRGCAAGCPVSELEPAGGTRRRAVPTACWTRPRSPTGAVLTLRGRLLADAVIRDLTG